MAITILLGPKLIKTNFPDNQLGKALKHVFIEHKIYNKLVTRIVFYQGYRPKFWQQVDAKYDTETKMLYWRRSGYNCPFEVTN